MAVRKGNEDSNLPAVMREVFGDAISVGTDRVSVGIEAIADPSGAPLQVAYTEPSPDREEEPERYRKWVAKVMHYISDADFKITDVINEVIELRHVLAYPGVVRDEESAKNGGPLYRRIDRLVLIDAHGQSYDCSSEVMLNSVVALFQLLGHPSTWEKPVPVIIRQPQVRDTWRALRLEVYDPDIHGERSPRKRR